MARRGSNSAPTTPPEAQIRNAPPARQPTGPGPWRQSFSYIDPSRYHHAMQTASKSDVKSHSPRAKTAVILQKCPMRFFSIELCSMCSIRASHATNGVVFQRNARQASLLQIPPAPIALPAPLPLPHYLAATQLQINPRFLTPASFKMRKFE